MISDQELLEKLNELKAIRPNADFARKNRELLCNQISGGQQPAARRPFGNFSWTGIVISTRAFADSYKPALVPALVLVLLFSSGLLGIRAARNTKPGDSLYIAKLFGEKTQLALTFDNKGKAKLGIEFATNRAKELSIVLSEPAAKENNDEKVAQVEELVDNFKSELKAVKSRIAKIDTSSQKTNSTDLKLSKPTTAAATTSADENSEFFTANLNKDTTGLEYAEGSTSKPSVETKESKAPETATTSQDNSKAATSTPEIVPAPANTDPEKILEQATDLLNNNDYGASLDKLNEADRAISQVGSGKVKGATDSASSSDEIVPSEKTSSSTRQ